MSVVIRKATFADAETVADYAYRLIVQHENYDAKRFSNIAEKEQMKLFYGNQTIANDSAVLVAESDGKIIGFAFIQFDRRNYALLLESAAWLHDIYIDESARNNNAGKSLVDAAIKAAVELGANKLILSVAARNKNARDFFERIGFKTTMVEMMLDLTK